MRRNKHSLRLLATAALGIAGLLGVAACNSNPFCLNCGPPDGAVDGPPPTDGPPPDQTPPRDGSMGGDGGGTCTPQQLESDPFNCGVCGRVCSYQNAAGVCQNGVCGLGACLPGYYNLDNSDANGCEYACTPSNPSTERCDSRDNNCNGLVDEGFNLQNDPDNCGVCGNRCALPNAITTCDRGQCLFVACENGFNNIDGNQQNGCEYTCPVNPPSIETCNGRDDDCDNQIDEGVSPPPNFCIQTSICSGASPTCQGTRGWVCNYTSVNPNIEVDTNGNLALTERLCDGIDGNCNGQIDESFPTLGSSCLAGSGRCQGSGTVACSANKLATTCSAQPVPTQAVDEVCNGIDDDCDGQVDERTPAAGSQCYNGGQHACRGWVDLMIQVGGIWIYQYEASRPGATANAAGTATGRACSNSGVLPWTTLNYDQAAAACAAVRDSTGTPLRLCTAPEWSSACNLGAATQSVWSYATNNTTYQANSCNGIDAGINASWPTGSGASCYANNTNGRIYDLSGNVAEWTSTSVLVDTTTYRKVRGGGFDTYSQGTNCNFDFTLARETYLAPSLGFRCCSSNTP